MAKSAATATIARAASGVSFDEMVHTGPGTLGSRYLRRFWQPVYHSADLVRGQAKPLRIMGDGFTIYRGESGEVHLTAARCPHRGTQLSTGMVEGEAIRCFYHGWKFDRDGQCTEQPAEDPDFAAKIRLKTYPVREYLGLVFAHLADDTAPEFPLYPEFEHFDGFVEIDSYVRHCNYFQNLENSLDMSHVPYVHGDHADAFRSIGRALKFQESDWGGTFTFTRQDGQAFVQQFGMPNVIHMTALPTDPEISWQESLFWWVPIDDSSHMQFSIHRVPAMGEAAQRIRERRQARRGEIDLAHQQVAEDILLGRLHLRDVNPKRCDMVRLQDNIAQVGQRRIADRSLDHPGVADVGVIALRKLWRRELSAFAEGRPTRAWKRTAGLTPSVWGRGGTPANTGAQSAESAAQIVDVRPFVEIDVQMRVLGAQMS